MTELAFTPLPESLVIYRSSRVFEREWPDPAALEARIQELEDDPEVIRVVHEVPPPHGLGLTPIATWARAADGRLVRRPYERHKLRVDIDSARLAEVCRRLGIRRLAVFGSVLTDDFDIVCSDIDVLVELGQDIGWGIIRVADALSNEIFDGRDVDIHTYQAANRSPILSKAVRDAVVLYETEQAE